MAHTWLREYPAFPRPVARLALGLVRGRLRSTVPLGRDATSGADTEADTEGWGAPSATTYGSTQAPQHLAVPLTMVLAELLTMALAELQGRRRSSDLSMVLRRASQPPWGDLYRSRADWLVWLPRRPERD